jgi:hypothetical protein
MELQKATTSEIGHHFCSKKQGDKLVIFYHSFSEIWPDNREELLWE